jgi:CBS domain-containing protein
VLFYLGFINLLLVAFNLIPAFPLDGGRMLRAGLWKLKGSLRWATRITSGIGSAFGILLIVVGVFSFINGFVIAGMWWFLLGMFLNSAAQMSYQQLLMRRILEGEPVHRLMQSNVITVSPQTRVDEFVQDYVYRHHHKLFPVATNGDLQGCMTTQRLKNLSRDQWPQHTVSELAEPCSGENTISADADSMEAFTRMTQDGRSRLIVVDQGRLQGVLTLKDLMRHISLKMELEP